MTVRIRNRRLWERWLCKRSLPTSLSSLSLFSLSLSFCACVHTHKHTHTHTALSSLLPPPHTHTTVLPLACHAYSSLLFTHACTMTNRICNRRLWKRWICERSVPLPLPLLSLFSPSLFLPARARSHTHTHTHRLGSPSLTIPSSRHSAHTCAMTNRICNRRLWERWIWEWPSGRQRLGGGGGGVTLWGGGGC
jgi:hypothetical protein